MADFSVNVNDSITVLDAPKQTAQTAVSNVIQIYGGSAGSGEFSQQEGGSFTADGTSIYAVDVYFSRTGTPTDNIIIKITSSLGGAALGSITIGAPAILTTLRRYYFETPVAVTQGNVYNIEISRSGARDTSNYMLMGYQNATNPYSGGELKKKDNNAWIADANADMTFRVLYEDAKLLLTPYFPINKSESITVTDQLTDIIRNNARDVYPSDSITVTESRKMLLTSNRSVSDSISVTENVKLQLVSSINKSESITVSESVNTRYSVSTLKDDFDDNSIASFWTPNNGADPTQVFERNQQVEITNAANSQYNTLETVDKYDITNNSVFVKYIDRGDQSITSHEVIFYIAWDATNKIWFTASNNQLSAYKFVSGVQSQVGSSISYDTSAHKYVRFRESAGTYYWDTSPDTNTWTNRWSVASFTSNNNVLVALQVGHWQDEASGSYGYFDNVNVNTLQFSVSESITVSESTKFALESLINTSDSVTLSESVSADITSFVNATDTITTNDSVSLDELITVNVNDTVSVSEDTAFEESTSELYVSVSDNITISESSQVDLGLAFSVNDTITTTESLILITSDPQISVSDQITVNEALQDELQALLNVKDDVTVSESLALQLNINVEVSDNITVAEQVNGITSDPQIYVSDSISVTDQPTVYRALVDISFSVSDTITLTESQSFDSPHTPDPLPQLVYIEGKLAWLIVEASIPHYILV